MALTLKVENEVAAPSMAEVRAKLSGQYRAKEAVLAAQRLSQAQAEFGISMSKEAIDEKVRISIPRKFGHRRYAQWARIDEYSKSVIPDAALMRFVAAQHSKLFDQFCVITPEYRRIQTSQAPPADPWLVGHITDVGQDRSYENSFNSKGRVRETIVLKTTGWIVLAYWD